MQQGMTAQDAGASLAVEHAAGQMPRAPPSLAIKQSSRGFAIIIVLKGPVPSDLSVSELGSDDSLWMLSANAERELFAFEPSSPFGPETQLMGENSTQ